MAKGVTLQHIWDNTDLELSDNFDFGLRYDNGTVTIAPTVFYGRYHNKQVTIYDSSVGLSYMQSNAEAESMDTANCQENGILLETIDHLKAALGDQLETLVLERIVIGIFFIGVKLSNGQGGLCFTPIKMIPEAVCCPSSAKAMLCARCSVTGGH